MKFIFSAVVFFASAVSVLAFNPILAEPPAPYQSIMVEGDPYVERAYLGTLLDAPDLYEFKSDVQFEFTARLRQRDSAKAVSFGLLLVKQNQSDGGVTEVVRMSKPVTEWRRIYDPALGITFLEGEVLTRELTPGTYRFEVSTPENRGAYVLMVGDEAVSKGYFKTLGDIWTIQNHLGYSVFRLFYSSFVYYPLAIIGILVLLYYAWHYKQRLFHVT